MGDFRPRFSKNLPKSLIFRRNHVFVSHTRRALSIAADEILFFRVPINHQPVAAASRNMQSVRKAILRHVSVTNSARPWSITKAGPSLGRTTSQMCTSACTSSDQLMARVIGMVKKYDRIDSGKVTETADFRKDLCLDSLDRVELVMAIEQEFNVEIPDDKADKFTCCADVVKYIMSEADQKIAENS